MNWHFEADAAADALRRMWGVTGISNNITVKARVNAADLSDQIKRALHRTWYEPKNVSVTTSGGHITLTGTVSSSNDRFLAATTAWAAPGATSVVNDILVS